MAALDFPASPAVNQLYTAPNGVTYQWTGVLWVVYGGGGGLILPVAAPTYDSTSALIIDNGTWTTGSNTVMQITQGQQVFSRSFTALDATHPIEVDATLNIGAGGAAITAVAGLFIDGAPAAVAQGIEVINATWSSPPLRIRWQGVLAAGPHTFSIRFAGNASNANLNGQNGGPIGGGAMATNMTIREVGVGIQGAPGVPGAAGPNNAASVVGRRVTNDVTTPATKVSLSAVSAALANAAGAITLVNAPNVTVDLTTGASVSTANGMDGHARGATAWIYLYLIATAAGAVAGLGSTFGPPTGGPTLPSGYTSWVYMGAMRVDGSGNLLRTLQLGNRSQYVNTGAGLPVICSGVQGSISTPTYVAQPVAAFVPPSANFIRLVPSTDGNVFVMVAPNANYGPSANYTNPPPIKIPGDAGSGGGSSMTAQLLLESGNIYVATNGNAHIFCLGWDDYCL